MPDGTDVVQQSQGVKVFGPLDATKEPFSNAQLSAMGYTAAEIDTFRNPPPPPPEDPATVGKWKGLTPAWAK